MNEIKPGDVLKICERHAKEGVGYHDPDTGFSINPQEEKAAPRRISGHLRARVKAGLLIVVAPRASASPSTAATRPDTNKGGGNTGVHDTLVPEGVAPPGIAAPTQLADDDDDDDKPGVFGRKKRKK